MKMTFAYTLVITLGILGAITLRADVVSQDFDDLDLVTTPSSFETNSWTINETVIVNSKPPMALPPSSGDQFAVLLSSQTSGASGTNSYVMSPWLTNGVGTISFYLASRSATLFGPYICDFRMTTNGTDWTTVQTITNTGGSWNPYSYEINSYAPIRFKIIKHVNGVAGTEIGVDSITTTEAPAKVDIIDHAISPASPTADDTVNVSAELDPSSLASNLVATLYWSANGGTSNTISMATNALSGGRYKTVSPITNQPAFTVIDYTVHVAFDGPTPLSPATASGSFFLRQPPLVSAYTNVSVKGGLTQALELVDDEYWMGVQNIASAGSYSLYFESVSSVTNEWRDPAQSRTTLPVFGAAVTSGGANIQLDSAPTNWLMFSFDERRSRYGIQQADVQDFNSANWTGFSGSSTIEGWSVTNGLATANAGLARDGNSIQFADTAAERTIVSPELTNGVGTILFRYRNSVTNGTPPAAFAIQTKATAGGSWQTVETVENIITPDYINHRYSVDNFDFRYVRIAGTGPAAAQLLIDDLIVTRPGATVTFAGLTNSPSDPTILDTVDVSVEVTAHNGAEINTNSPPTLWFRAFDDETTYALPITFDNFDGRGTLTDFPALIKLTTANTDGYAGFLDTANGYDLRFWAGAALTGTELDYEIENFNSSGTSEIWVKVPALSHNTTIYATWGNTNYNDQASYTTNGAVWSANYAGVWHLNGNFEDSTSNGRDGSNTGSADTSGIAANARRFGGIADADIIEITPDGDIDYGDGNQLTVLAFAKMTAPQDGDAGNGYIVQKARYTGSSPYALYVSGSSLRATVNGTTISPSASYNDGSWHGATMTLNGSSLKLYIDGAESGSSSSAVPADNNENVAIGSSADMPSYRPFLGDIDEVRISTVERSANWIWACHMAIGSHTDFTSYGTAGPLDQGSIYDPIPMTSANGTNWTATIPRGARGTMQYYVESTYLDPATGGYASANEPLDRTGFPAAYTNRDVGAAMQDFDDLDLVATPSSFETNSWTINETVIVNSKPPMALPPSSGDQFAVLLSSQTSGASGTNSYVMSPWLTNGVGTISFYLASRSATLFGPYICDFRMTTNGTDWTTVQTITNTGGSWNPYSYEINSYAPIRFKIIKHVNGVAGTEIGVDSISLTYPPAYVTASDFALQPAYPSQETNTTVACTIESATSFHQAFNITGTLMYRTRDNSFSSWTGWAPASMYRGTGNRFYGDIPAQLNLTEVEYYVEAGFNGYSAEGEGMSPMAFPAPEAALGFTSRRYDSAFEQLGIRVGTTDVANFNQLGNGQWEGVLTFVDATNNPAFTISGYGYYDGTNVQSGFYGTWGDNNPFRTNMPLEGVASLSENAIIIPEAALGQYIIRFDENSGDYSVQRAAYQDFENWKGGNAFFGESFAAAEMTDQEQTFNTWAASEAIIESNFEDAWDSVHDYPDNWIITESTDTGGTGIFFYIEQGIVVTQALGQAALLAPESNRGYIRNDVQGAAGDLSFDLRAASPNDFRPAIHPEVTNTSMRIQATLMATDMPTNSTLDAVGFAYKSIIGNYIDEDNFYEARVVQMSANTKRYELWKKVSGIYSRLGAPSSTYDGSITDANEYMSLRFWLPEDKIRFMWKAGTSWPVLDRTDSSLTSAYAFGFNGMDASLAVDDVKVFAVTNSSFDYDSNNPVYQEDFSTGATNWNGSGVWTVSDGRYTRPGYTGTPIEARVEFSPSLTFSPLTTVRILTNLTHSYYQRYTANVHTAASGYVRVRNFSGDGYLIIDNIKRTAWRGKAVSDNGWTGSNVWVETASESGRGIELRTSRALAAAEQSVTSPLLTNGVSLIAFDYLPANDATGAVAFAIDYRVNGEDWTNITTKTDSSTPTNWVHYAFSVDDAILREDIIRMRVRNITAGADDGLRIDNLVITELIPINDTTWWGYNVLVTDQKPEGIYDSEASPWRARIANNQYGAFLNNSSTNGTADGATNDLYYPFIRSARLPDGIGEIRFLYRAWDTNASEITIVASTNRELPDLGWVELATVSVTSTNYQEYISTDIFERNYHYLGLRVDSKNGSLGRVGIDNILIVAPVGADLELKNLRLEPEIPVAGDNVFVKVDVEDQFFSPTDIALNVLYRTGTNNWGNHSTSDSIEMEIDEDRGDSITYISKTPITQTVIDTVVQYQVEATFNGLNADRSSPKYFRGFENPDHYWPIDLNRDLPGTNTPYYIVFSCLPGQVWINELNIKDDSIPYPTGQFIELAGWGQANIGDWRLEVINTDFTTNTAYTFGPNFKIGSSPTNYHFYVFGHTNVVGRNRDLTNSLPYSGGLQLVRQRGIIDQQISYDTFGEAGKAMVSPDNRFVYVGFDDDWEDYSISMIGSGSNLANFETNWVNTTAFSIGTTNFGQTLIPWPTNGPPVGPEAYTGSVTIVSAALSNASDRVYFNAIADVASLVPSVWYVTNLLNVTSNDWQRRTEDFGYNAAGTNYEIWCRQVTPPVFYRIGMSAP